MSDWQSMLLKAPVRKKSFSTIQGNDVRQELGNYDFIKDWTDWKTKLQGIDAGKMGLSTKQGVTMYTMLMNHGKPKRSKSPNSNDGVGSILQGIDKIILALAQNNRPMTEDDLEKVIGFIDDIEDMEDSSLDPRNIPFTTPIEVVGKVGKFPEDNKPNVFGHYNTPNYRKLQANKGKDAPPEIPSSWYSDTAGQNSNPLYQVIFMRDNEMGVTGLIHILKDLEKAGEGAVIKEIIVRTRRNYNEIMQIDDLKKKLARLIKRDQTVYLGGKNKNVINQSALLRKIKDMTFDVKSNEERFLRNISGIDEVLGDIETFKIDITKTGMMNQILPKLFKQVKRMKAPNGEPVLFRKPKPQPAQEAPAQESQPQVDEGEKGENQMKKSWRLRLWQR